ncbi:biogenesis of lysosome-related organelles complex-1 subunit 2 [Daktulosphaira vitifoliae]|uniref:biogenesis of lysosome-related organelles complex-1 subunit 2 n=1 Tax=Daktulosphaira vitifoliae TaxID=58002 RepID=UPI0021AAA39D|nr:biogenesis of lysosome-related organelles complex-1 subunit 2 [Daktulosphaira vitifoliae]
MADEEKIENIPQIEESPKKGPTLSTSTSSFERNDPHDPNLSLLSTKMFQKISEYLTGELNITEEDYKLLEIMNKATTQKYASYKHLTIDISNQILELNKKYKTLEPYLIQIDQIEDSVSKLEQAAFKLDSYAKRLEAKYKSLEKRQ